MTIGIPQITAYGSSYGTFGGANLANYTSPEPNTPALNDRDAVSTGEWKLFERSIRDYVLAKLGEPIVKVELSDFQIKLCIEEAISKLDYHAPQWMTQYAVFEASAGINVYELPPAVVNNLTDVWYKRNLPFINTVPGSFDYDMVTMFFTGNGFFNNMNIGQYLLMQMYLKQVKRVLGQGSTWNIINNRYLQLFPTPACLEDVILEFRGIDANTILPAYKNWLQRFSLCQAKEVLGRIRSKFQVLPGPGGGTKLDGEILLREAIDEREKLMEELTTEIEGPPLIDMF